MFIYTAEQLQNASRVVTVCETLVVPMDYPS